MKRKMLFVLTLMLVLSGLAGSVLAAPPQQGPDVAARLQAQSNGKLVVESYAPTGVARWLSAGEDGVLTREFAGTGASPETVARSFLSSYGSLFGLADEAGQLRLQDVRTDELGMSHVRFTQEHDGLAVFGAAVLVHLDADGTVREANGYVVPGLEALDTKATVAAEEAGSLVRGLVDAADAAVAESSLVILNPGMITDQPSESYLTYRIRVDSAEEPHKAMWYFVDAQTGQLRFEYAAVTHGRNRTTYNLRGSTNYATAVVARTEFQGPVASAQNCTATDVNRAHDYAGNTYDFFRSRFNRDSYNNGGASLISVVCYGVNYQNAFWNGQFMTYGQGFANADDVVAHELTHAVTEYAAGLLYAYQSGALNESYSDIFGEAVDLTNGAGSDASSLRWSMGEDVPGFGALRDMKNPPRFNDPDRVGSSRYQCGSSDNGGVHSNSGVPNKAFYLMVDGGSFNGINVGAIGMDRATRIQYRALDAYLLPTSKFIDNYNALRSACGALYGSSSATCTNVRKALEAVRMNQPVCGSIIENGGFEVGRFSNQIGTAVSWREISNHSAPLVARTSPYSGAWAAYLAGLHSDVSEIRQTIRVPAAGGTLNFRYRIVSSDVCGYDKGFVTINTSNLKTYSLCRSTSGGYRSGSVSLGAYKGQTVTLRFRSTTDASLLSNFFIDNVSFSTSTLLIGDEAGADETTVVEAKPADAVESLEPKQFTPDASVLTEAPAIFEEAPVGGSSDE